MLNQQEIEYVARAIRFVSHGVPIDKEIARSTWISQAEAAIRALDEIRPACEYRGYRVY